MKILSIIALLSLLLTVQTAGAMSMGTVVKKDTMTITNDGLAKFTILFWNVENNSYNVELYVKELPKGWLVNIQPEEFMLNSSSGSEHVVLSSDKTVKAFPVNVSVVPENPEPGKYQITLVARAGVNKEGMSFFQEREFRLNVNVTESKSSSVFSKIIESIKSLTGRFLENSEESKSDVESIYTNSRLKSFTGMIVGIFHSTYFLYFAIVVCILVVSLTIYKYA